MQTKIMNYEAVNKFKPKKDFELAVMFHSVFYQPELKFPLLLIYQLRENIWSKEKKA